MGSTYNFQEFKDFADTFGKVLSLGSSSCYLNKNNQQLKKRKKQRPPQKVDQNFVGKVIQYWIIPDISNIICVTDATDNVCVKNQSSNRTQKCIFCYFKGVKFRIQISCPCKRNDKYQVDDIHMAFQMMPMHMALRSYQNIQILQMAMLSLDICQAQADCGEFSEKVVHK